MEILGMPAYKKLQYGYYLLMVTIGVYLLSTLFIFFIDQKLVDEIPPAFEEVTVQEQSDGGFLPFAHYEKIWERNLFSVIADEEDQITASDLMAQIDRLALTSLNCTLIGTIINALGDSWAVIRDNQSNQEGKYTVGSAVSGAKVVMILRNKVVLNIDGRDELLVMGIEKLKAEREADEKAIKGADTGQTATYKVSSDFFRESMNNVSQIMANVRFKPHFRNGQPEGFQVSSLKGGSILKTMGFQDGDIIKSVNGQDIRSAEDIMSLYKTLKDARFFSVGIVRNDATKTLNFKVR